MKEYIKILLTSLHSNSEIGNDLKSLDQYRKYSGEIEKKYYSKVVCADRSILEYQQSMFYEREASILYAELKIGFIQG